LRGVRLALEPALTAPVAVDIEAETPVVHLCTARLAPNPCRMDITQMSAPRRRGGYP
jgi:hypothetical protein